MTIGQLLAIAAILDTHNAPGAAKLLAAVEAEMDRLRKEEIGDENSEYSPGVLEIE